MYVIVLFVFCSFFSFYYFATASHRRYHILVRSCRGCYSERFSCGQVLCSPRAMTSTWEGVPSCSVAKQLDCVTQKSSLTTPGCGASPARGPHFKTHWIVTRGYRSSSVVRSSKRTLCVTAAHSDLDKRQFFIGDVPAKLVIPVYGWCTVWHSC